LREVLARGEKSSAAIAGRRAAEHYKGMILAQVSGQRREFYRFVLLLPQSKAAA